MNKIVAVGILPLLALCDVEPSVAQVLPRNDSYEVLKMNDAKFKDWLLRWERNILSGNSMHYCSSEMGEEIGWKMSPFFKGLLLRISGHGEHLVGRQAGSMHGRLDQKSGKGTRRIPGLAQGWCCGYQGRQSR